MFLVGIKKEHSEEMGYSTGFIYRFETVFAHWGKGLK